MFFLEFAQSPDYDFFNIFYDLFLCSFGILLPMFKKKTKKTPTPTIIEAPFLGSGCGRVV
jgi:phage-related protein